MEISPEIQAKLDQVARLPRGARIGIVSALVIAIGAGYFFMVYKDLSDQVQSQQAKELELQRKLTEVRAIAANLTAFEEEITDLEAQLAVALTQLPNQKQLEVLLTDISNLGKTAGIEMKSFARKPEKAHDFYSEVPLAIELEGSYHNVAKFFDLVSKLPRIVNLGKINMSVSSEDDLETRLKVTGTATTFRFVGKG